MLPERQGTAYCWTSIAVWPNLIATADNLRWMQVTIKGVIMTATCAYQILSKVQLCELQTRQGHLAACYLLVIYHTVE
jgi:hypothetical protein